MEQREWRREMKETQGNKQGATKATRRQNKKPVFQYTHTHREKKKNQKFTVPFYSLPKKKERKSLVWMIRTVPQWQQKSHCAVDIYVSSLPVQTKKLTTDRLRIISAAQTINVCAVQCSVVLFSFPGKKNQKKK
jgi:hypothetical protein